MKRMLILSVLLVLILGACTAEVDEEPVVETPVEETPVDEKDPSIVSFGDMTNIVNFQLDDATKFYTLTSPDNQVIFSISSDIAFTTPFDYKMEIDATPFIDAGLDTSLLAEGVFVDNKIVFGHDLGNEGVNVQDVVPAFESVVRIDPSLVGYHEALDHYGLSIGDGNAFEWASDFSTNDKDIVFILNPQTFIDAGVDVKAIEGWVFAEVEVMGADGKMTMVEKLLKPFEIK